MNSFKKQLIFHLIVGFIILVALSVGLVFFGYNIKDYVQKISKARAELLERSLSLAYLASLKNQYETKAKDYLIILNNIIPTRDALINFFKEIQITAENVSGFGFTFESETPPSDNSLGVINFIINLQATFPQFKKFLENMENFKYLVTVENFSLERQSGEVFQIPIRGKVFYKSNESQKDSTN